MSRSKRSRRVQPDISHVSLGAHEHLGEQFTLACRERDEAQNDVREADKELAEFREKFVVRCTLAFVGACALAIFACVIGYYDGKDTRELEFEQEIAGTAITGAYDERTGEFHRGFNQPQLCYFDHDYQGPYTGWPECIDAPADRKLTDSGDTDDETFALNEQRARIVVSDFMCSEDGCEGGNVCVGDICAKFTEFTERHP